MKLNKEDLQILKVANESSSFVVLRKLLAQEREEIRSKLETESNRDELLRLQGCIRQLNRFANLPSMMVEALNFLEKKEKAEAEKAKRESVSRKAVARSKGVPTL